MLWPQEVCGWKGQVGALAVPVGAPEQGRRGAAVCPCRIGGLTDTPIPPPGVSPPGPGVQTWAPHESTEEPGLRAAWRGVRVARLEGAQHGGQGSGGPGSHCLGVGAGTEPGCVLTRRALGSEGAQGAGREGAGRPSACSDPPCHHHQEHPASHAAGVSGGEVPSHPGPRAPRPRSASAAQLEWPLFQMRRLRFRALEARRATPWVTRPAGWGPTRGPPPRRPHRLPPSRHRACPVLRASSQFNQPNKPGGHCSCFAGGETRAQRGPDWPGSHTGNLESGLCALTTEVRVPQTVFSAPDSSAAAATGPRVLWLQEVSPSGGRPS